MQRMACVLLALLCQGCADEGFPKYVELGPLRILALQADTPNPDTSAGTATVTITPYVSDLFGSGRSLTYTAESCFDPGIAYGVTATCEGSPTRTVIASNAAVGGLSSPNYTGAVTTFNVTAPLQSLIHAGRREVDQFNGIVYLVTYKIQAGDGTTINAFKRILITSQTPKNSNPVTDDILNANDNSSVDGVPGVPTPLVPNITSGAESYFFKDNAGKTFEMKETLTTTWFIGDGSVDFYRTEGSASSTYRPPDPIPNGRDVVIVAVTRDGRGGVSVVQKNL